MQDNIQLIGLLCIIFFVCGFGVVSLFRPLTIIRGLMMWPRFVVPRLFKEEQASSQFRALRLIEEDPELYKVEYRTQINSIKFTGVVAIILSLLATFIGFVDFVMPIG